MTRLSATATVAETGGATSEKRGNGSTIVKNEFHDFFGASAMVHNTNSEKSVVSGRVSFLIFDDHFLRFDSFYCCAGCAIIIIWLAKNTEY